MLIRDSFFSFLDTLKRKLQDLNSDPLALGEVFRVHYPREWEKVDWKRIYAAADLKLTVKYETKNYGVYR